MHRIPNCYGSGAQMLDDCMVSCGYWEECMFDHEEKEEQDARAQRMKPIWDYCTACNHQEQCGGCHAEDINEACKTCPALTQDKQTKRMGP